MKIGRGVFAAQEIKKGSIVDVSPVIVFSDEEKDKHITKTILDHYT